MVGSNVAGAAAAQIEKMGFTTRQAEWVTGARVPGSITDCCWLYNLLWRGGDESGAAGLAAVAEGLCRCYDDWTEVRRRVPSDSSLYLRAELGQCQTADSYVTLLAHVRLAEGADTRLAEAATTFTQLLAVCSASRRGSANHSLALSKLQVARASLDELFKVVKFPHGLDDSVVRICFGRMLAQPDELSPFDLRDSLGVMRDSWEAEMDAAASYCNSSPPTYRYTPTQLWEMFCLCPMPLQLFQRGVAFLRQQVRSLQQALGIFRLLERRRLAEGMPAGQGHMIRDWGLAIMAFNSVPTTFEVLSKVLLDRDKAKELGGPGEAACLNRLCTQSLKHSDWCDLHLKLKKLGGTSLFHLEVNAMRLKTARSVAQIMDTMDDYTGCSSEDSRIIEFLGQVCKTNEDWVAAYRKCASGSNLACRILLRIVKSRQLEAAEVA